MMWVFLFLAFALSRRGEADLDYSDWPNLPHAAFIFSMKYEPLCAGSLIAPSLVLTSAMCVIEYRNKDGSDDKKFVWIGSKGGEQRSYTTKSVAHHKAEKRAHFYPYDIGAYYLGRTLSETPHVKKIWIQIFTGSDNFYDSYSDNTYTTTVPLLRGPAEFDVRKSKLTSQPVKPCSSMQRKELVASMKTAGKPDIVDLLNDGLTLSCLHHVQGGQYCAYDSGASVITFASGNRPIFLGMISKTTDSQKGCKVGPSSSEADLLTPVWVIKDFTKNILHVDTYGGAEMLEATRVLAITSTILFVLY